MSQFKSFPISFESPLDILVLYDDDILEHKVKVHPWQANKLRSAGRKRANKDEVIFEALIAANGSGKSQFVLAPFVVWMALNFIESLTIVTTASGEQLDTQAFRYVRRLCEKVNLAHRDLYKDGVFDIKYRRITCNITGSFIDMFATDEPGKAEGRHPITSDGEFSIVVDECKTVKDDIQRALERCRGITRRLDISSPGDCQGHFYDICTLEGSPYKIDKVTAFDCPHIRKQEIEWTIKKYGEHDPLVRSSIFAEFTSLADSVVITREVLKDCYKYFEHEVNFGDRRAGLDLAAGGDENVLSVWDGNINVGLECFRYSNTVMGVNRVIDFIHQYKIKPENIYADDGGIGRGMIDLLHEKGFKVKRVLNQSTPFDSTRYANKGTEMWFSFKRFVEERQVKLIKDSTLEAQLTNRYYRQQTGTGKIILESKMEARKKGHPSPDRADATVLAWSKYYYPLQEIENKLRGPVKSEASGVSIASLERIMTRRQVEALLNANPEAQNNKNVNNGLYVKSDFTFSQSKIFSGCSPRNFGSFKLLSK